MVHPRTTIEHPIEPWWQADVPPPTHECQVYTRGSTGRLPVVERCACGAIRLGAGRPWMERNTKTGTSRIAPHEIPGQAGEIIGRLGRLLLHIEDVSS